MYLTSCRAPRGFFTARSAFIHLLFYTKFLTASQRLYYLNDIAVFDTDDSLGGVGYGLLVGYNNRGDALGV